MLAQVAFPRIRSLDSSRTPHRSERPAPAPGLAAVDPSALRSALAQMAADAPATHDHPAAPGHAQVMELQTRLWARERELVAASARIAELKAATRSAGDDHAQHDRAAPVV